MNKYNIIDFFRREIMSLPFQHEICRVVLCHILSLAERFTT